MIFRIRNKRTKLWVIQIILIAVSLANMSRVTISNATLSLRNNEGKTMGMTSDLVLWQMVASDWC